MYYGVSSSFSGCTRIHTFMYIYLNYLYTYMYVYLRVQCATTLAGFEHAVYILSAHSFSIYLRTVFSTNFPQLRRILFSVIFSGRKIEKLILLVYWTISYERQHRGPSRAQSPHCSNNILYIRIRRTSTYNYGKK